MVSFYTRRLVLLASFRLGLYCPLETKVWLSELVVRPSSRLPVKCALSQKVWLWSRPRKAMDSSMRKENGLFLGERRACEISSVGSQPAQPGESSNTSGRI